MKLEWFVVVVAVEVELGLAMEAEFGALLAVLLVKKAGAEERAL